MVQMIEAFPARFAHQPQPLLRLLDSPGEHADIGGVGSHQFVESLKNERESLAHQNEQNEQNVIPVRLSEVAPPFSELNSNNGMLLLCLVLIIILTIWNLSLSVSLSRAHRDLRDIRNWIMRASTTP